MTNPFTIGYASLNDEISVASLPIEGTIPRWLVGTLLRNGPAKFEFEQEELWHWFDGLAMLHRFSFQDGNVSYANKFLQSDANKTSKEEGRITFPVFASDPCKALFKHSVTEMMLNPNVSIQKVSGDFLALTEIPLPMAFDPHTLDTLGVVEYKDHLTGQHSSAHPLYDFASKTMISYMTEFGLESTFKVFGIKSGEHQRTLIGSYPVAEPSYIHSFSITERYVVIAEYPYRVVPAKLLTGGKSFIQNFEWRPQDPTLFIVMSKQDGSIIGRYESEAFFSFHHINAFERAGEIIVDLSAYPDTKVIDESNLPNLRKGRNDGKDPYTAPSEYRRYHLPLHGSSSTVTYELMSEYEIELPTINYPRSNAHDYGVAYGISLARNAPVLLAHQLVRVDVHERTSNFWSAEGCNPGEPIFVQAPDARAEDDGVVLSVVLNANKGNSFLLVLDAHTFEELGRAEVPHHIPLGIHGMYFPEV